MHPSTHILSFISIMSLMLGSLTGCGEKRIHVASSSGTPAQEILIEPADLKTETPTAEHNDTSLNESDLSSLNSTTDIASEEPSPSFAENMSIEPVNMAHAPRVATKDDVSEPNTVDMNDPSSNYSLEDPSLSAIAEVSSIPEPEFTEDAPARVVNDAALPALSEGQNLSAQSDSSIDKNSTEEVSASDLADNIASIREGIGRPLIESTSDLTDTPVSQNSETELKNSFAEEDIAPAPETLEIAKAQPSGSLEDQIARIKKEELATAAAGLQDVFFPFDSWTLTKEGKHSLKSTLNWFKHDFSSVLIIEGHSDQRGTQAYNMILGKRRAHAVRDYLSKSGIDPSHLITISYGKDKPFCQDITEVCHQLNRRGHLLVQNP